MTTPDEIWDAMVEESDELAEELDLGGSAFRPGSLGALDRWLAAEGALDDEAAARVGFYLARLLVETHGGGLVRIREKGHPLEGEWAVTGFARGLANDYHVPFFVSATRIAVDRALSARDWYAQVLREGR